MHESVPSAISRALDQDSRTTHAVIDVACFGGQVTLSGEVSSPAEKAAAVTVAKEVSGVVTVDDELVVRPRAIRK